MVSASAPHRTALSLPVTTRSATYSPLLQAAIEECMDGMLIVTAQGTIVELNQQAQQLCDALNLAQGATLTPDGQSCVPEQIWQPCQQLIAANQFLPGQPIVPEFEIPTGSAQTLRVRLRWLEAAHSDLNDPCLLVILEQRGSSVSSTHHHRLSQREYQVWQLRVQGYSYQSIASQLYITTHTVKKHLKNIRIKQRAARSKTPAVA